MKKQTAEQKKAAATSLAIMREISETMSRLKLTRREVGEVSGIGQTNMAVLFKRSPKLETVLLLVMAIESLSGVQFQFPSFVNPKGKSNVKVFSQA